MLQNFESSNTFSIQDSNIWLILDSDDSWVTYSSAKYQPTYRTKGVRAVRWCFSARQGQIFGSNLFGAASFTLYVYSIDETFKFPFKNFSFFMTRSRSCGVRLHFKRNNEQTLGQTLQGAFHEICLLFFRWFCSHCRHCSPLNGLENYKTLLERLDIFELMSQKNDLWNGQRMKQLIIFVCFLTFQNIFRDWLLSKLIPGWLTFLLLWTKTVLVGRSFSVKFCENGFRASCTAYFHVWCYHGLSGLVTWRKNAQLG